MVTSRFRGPSKLCITTCTAVSAHLKNTTAKRRDVAKQLLGQESRRRKQCRHRCRRLQHLGLPRMRKGKDELDRRSMGIDFADSPPPDLVPNVDPDGGLRRLVRPGADKEERVELACCQARKPSNKESRSNSASSRLHSPQPDTHSRREPA